MITQEWLVKGDVLKIKMSGNLDLTELSEHQGELLAILNRMNDNKKLNALVDLSEVTKWIVKFGDITKLQSMREVSRHPNKGRVVIFTTNTPLIYLVSIVGNLQRVPIQVVSSEAAAIDVIKKWGYVLEHI